MHNDRTVLKRRTIQLFVVLCFLLQTKSSHFSFTTRPQIARIKDEQNKIELEESNTNREKKNCSSYKRLKRKYSTQTTGSKMQFMEYYRWLWLCLGLTSVALLHTGAGKLLWTTFFIFLIYFLVLLVQHRIFSVGCCVCHYRTVEHVNGRR